MIFHTALAFDAPLRGSPSELPPRLTREN